MMWRLYEHAGQLLPTIWRWHEKPARLYSLGCPALHTPTSPPPPRPRTAQRCSAIKRGRARGWMHEVRAQGTRPYGSKRGNSAGGERRSSSPREARAERQRPSSSSRSPNATHPRSPCPRQARPTPIRPRPHPLTAPHPPATHPPPAPATHPHHPGRRRLGDRDWTKGPSGSCRPDWRVLYAETNRYQRLRPMRPGLSLYPAQLRVCRGSQQTGQRAR